MNPKKIKLFLGMVFAVSVFGFLVSSISAATNISSAPAEHWAWNDTIGWIDFNSTDNVEVTFAKIKGYATSSVGYIAFDCATSPNGNICTASSTFRVSNDGSGNLSGWAWNDAIGWISFDNVTAGSPYLYQVQIDAGGNFYGWAWNDIIGWISFNKKNCDADNNGFIDVACGGDNTTIVAIDYKVKTTWSTTAATGTLLSSIFDTGVSEGAAFNSIMWQGSQNGIVGIVVKFQFASADSTSTSALTPVGPNGTTNIDDTYNPTGPDHPIALTPRLRYNNYRYFRYRVFLQSDSSQTVSPRVDDIIINWSP